MVTFLAICRLVHLELLKSALNPIITQLGCRSYLETPSAEAGPGVNYVSLRRARKAEIDTRHNNRAITNPIIIRQAYKSIMFSVLYILLISFFRLMSMFYPVRAVIST